LEKRAEKEAAVKERDRMRLDQQRERERSKKSTPSKNASRVQRTPFQFEKASCRQFHYSTLADLLAGEAQHHGRSGICYSSV
jgi:hypothetical protein